ncbi:hypothetical protein [Caloranaerobacter sp. DY30410]|uniref:hypothetical protein n=1 Tax=Caloranaerobacter sp. DY30410 TaxID=3238305 RepID=UPI003D02D089
MRKFKVGILGIVSVLTVLSILGSLLFTGYVNAESIEENYTVFKVHEVENNPDAVFHFVDKSLKGKTRALQSNPKNEAVEPMGVIYEEYDHSYYTERSTTKVSYRVGPVENVQHQFDVPRGSTQTRTIGFTGSGTVQYSGSVSAEIKKIVNLSLGATASGSISLTYERTDTFSGPPEGSPYNARGYYTAKDYDKYTVVVDKWDVYKVYNGGAFDHYETYYAGTVTVSNVKKPITVEYSKDFTY